MGRVDAIWLKRAKLAPMDAVDRAELVRDRGIVGNANQGGRRQVTIIEREAWQRMMGALGADLDPAARRANVLISGIGLKESRGRVLVLGACRIAIMGETRPCERMDDALLGLRDAMRPEWNGGVFGVVVQGGEIRIGDTAALEDVPPAEGASAGTVSAEP